MGASKNMPTSQSWKYPKLVLASASPRRSEILIGAGLKFEILATDFDEQPLHGESPEQLVRRLATGKARAAHATIHSPHGRAELRGLPILGADTVVAIGGEIMGKPSSAAEARYMLGRLAGNIHEVLTGVAILFPAPVSEPVADVRVAATSVQFRPMTSAQIEDYIASGEPFDKAGGYGIQGLAAKFVERIEGCYFNVVGLPVSLVCVMLETNGQAAYRKTH